MEKKIPEMQYKEAWEKLQKDYFRAIGYMYRYMRDKYGEDKVIDYLREVEVERFRSETSAACSNSAPGGGSISSMRLAVASQWATAASILRLPVPSAGMYSPGSRTILTSRTFFSLAKKSV